MPTTTCGSEHARAHLPELLDQAHRGEVTVITRHGRPWAAVVPVDRVIPARKTSLMSLQGSGSGLWGTDPARTIARMRDEWA